MAKIYISLGTNLGDKLQNLQQATAQINERCGTIEQKSSIYSSAPWGFESFNNFLNQVVAINSTLRPLELMKELLIIERNLGRKRLSDDYQDRLIDIDILFYDDLILEDSNLTIPHPKLQLRNFILEPLLEMNPLLVHPALQKSIAEISRTSTDPYEVQKL